MDSGSALIEEKRWVNKPHPRLADPEDRRAAQLRRGQVQLGRTRAVDFSYQH